MESIDKWFMFPQLSYSGPDKKVYSTFGAGIKETPIGFRRAPVWNLKSGEKCFSSL